MENKSTELEYKHNYFTDIYELLEWLKFWQIPKDDIITITYAPDNLLHVIYFYDKNKGLDD